ncbi:hypothetical protein BC826DRAFT_1109082 [Russula brevipes]|nr:hypothetical protein BC826DRAFT_1109082 [Russula brevipes]
MAAHCCGVGLVTIDKLPDDALLEIFVFYLDYDIHGPYQDFDKWHTLVHVCQRWRNVVFASPRRLDLRLLCRKDRPVRAMPDIWPALPISIDIEDFWSLRWKTRLDNFKVALEHPDRVRSINLTDVPGIRGDPLIAAMQVQFPELTEMRVGRCEPFIRDSFLGGSAPRLRTLWLRSVPFPAAPTLLLSASELVDLTLDCIPISAYIPPATMVTCLSSLNKLESLFLGFVARPERPRPPPQSRVVLPTLIKFTFEGMSEYLEDLVAHIDTPVLNQLNVTFFPMTVFDVRHLKQFIDRAKELKPPKAAEMRFASWSIHIDMQQPHSSSSLGLGIKRRRYEGIGQQVSSLALLCDQVSHFFSLVERLDLQTAIRPRASARASTEFLEIFRLLTATRSLYVHKDLVPLIVPVLLELIGARCTEVLPNLRELFLGRSVSSGSVREAIRPFVDARRLSGQPVAVQFLGERGTVVR